MSSGRVIIWHIGMNLLRKAAEFEQLCAKFAQTTNQSFRFNTPIPEASLSGPTPQFRVFKTPEEAHDEALKALPTVNVHDLPAAPTVQPAKTAPQAKLPMEMLGTFSKSLMNFDPTQFSGVSVDAEALKAAGNKLNTAVANKQASEILKALTEVLGLTRNGGGQLYAMAYKLYNAVKAATQPKEPAQWLTQYMNQQKLMDQGEAMKNQMQAALSMPSAVQNALDRSK